MTNEELKEIIERVIIELNNSKESKKVERLLQLSKGGKKNMSNTISMERHEEIVTELQYKIEKLEDEAYLLHDKLDDTIQEYEEEIDELKGDIEALKEKLKSKEETEQLREILKKEGK